MHSDRSPHEELLLLVYKAVGPYVYGSINTVDPETYARGAAHGGTLNLTDWSTPFRYHQAHGWSTDRLWKHPLHDR